MKGKINEKEEMAREKMENEIGMKVVFEDELEQTIRGFFEYEFGTDNERAPMYARSLIDSLRLMMSSFDPLERAAIIFRDLSGSEEICDYMTERMILEAKHKEEYLKLNEYDFVAKLRDERECRWNEEQKGKKDRTEVTS
jgi:hypothetical protein